MHPSKFFNECALRTGIDTFEIYDKELKDKLSSLDIIVKEIELGKEFEIGKTGFNLLTREEDKLLSNKVQSRYAAVGTYSITSKTLNVFIRLRYVPIIASFYMENIFSPVV